jgi:predicted ATP-grasp superfamily ATP-dependent carboligase
MIPVVLLGGLEVVRALGLARIPVVIASSERRTPSMASRYCAGAIELPPIARREEFVSALAEAGRRLGPVEAGGRLGCKPPLFYDNDDRLALVQEYRAALEPHFSLLLNDPQLADALIHKERFQALAEFLGLPVPRRIGWEALEAEAGPVLVKPKSRTAWDNSLVRLQLFAGAGKARVFASGREAAADRLVRSLAPQLAFQEYIPGGDDEIWSFHGFAAPGGEVLEWFVGRKIRTYPAGTGDSSYLRLERNKRLVKIGREVAARLRIAGIFKMDFKGRHLLEVNTRFNLWHYVGAKNGVNLPEVAYQYLVYGHRPIHGEAQTRYRWLSLRYDKRAYRQYGLSRWQWLASLLEAPKVYELFSWSDPMPFARYWTRRLRGALSRRMHRWLATAS